jgi:hypothetical protein
MQPGAKPGPLRIVFPLLRCPRDGHQDLLRNVLGIGVLHPFAPRQAKDHGPVNLDELLPRRLIARIANAYQ